jgi:hypothetical protein
MKALAADRTASKDRNVNAAHAVRRDARRWFGKRAAWPPPRWLLVLAGLDVASVDCRTQSAVPFAAPGTAARFPPPAASSDLAPPLSGHNLISKADFKDGKWAPWWTHYEYPGSGYPNVQNSEFCFTMTSNALKPSV